MKTLAGQVFAIIAGNKRGWVFTPGHFARLGDPRVVGVALTHLTRKGVIRRLSQGLYDYPVQHPKLGLLSPAPEKVAKVLADRDAARLQPSGAYAANLLGLSEQVPMRVVFLTDRKARTVRIGKLEIILKRTNSSRAMATAGRASGLVIQALKYLGRQHVDDRTIRLLRERLAPKDKAQLLKDVSYAPGWVAPIMLKVAQEDT